MFFTGPFRLKTRARCFVNYLQICAVTDAECSTGKDEQIQAVWSPNLEKGHLIPHPSHEIYT